MTIFKHFHCVTLCQHGMCYGLYLCPSVKTQASVLSTMAKRGITQTTSCDCQGTLAFSAKDTGEIQMRSPPTGMPNMGEVCYNWQFSTNILLDLRNAAKERRCCCRRLIRIPICSIKQCYFQWPWVALTTKTTPFSTFCVSFPIFIMGGNRDFRFGTQLWQIGWS